MLFLQLQVVSKNQIADLFDLIGFTFPVPGLYVQDFVDPVPGENMMVSSNPLLETKLFEQSTKSAELNIRIRPFGKNVFV
jgi:hypothetical protein